MCTPFSRLPQALLMRLDSFFSGALCVLSGGRLPEALFMVFLLDSKGAKKQSILYSKFPQSLRIRFASLWDLPVTAARRGEARLLAEALALPEQVALELHAHVGAHAAARGAGRGRRQRQGRPGLQIRMRVEFKFQTSLNFRTFTVP